ncbi:MAG: GlsB/YeaQ/YmgE family stress response membrane protein [bacterium]|nr:GlsB/YeaQ/YmgE family stress response membrane protein [bacterium]
MGEFIGGVWYFCCGWLIIGALAGMISRSLLGSRNQPLLNDILLGVAGAFIGGIVVGWLGWDDNLNIGFGIGSLVTAIIGAGVLILLGRLVFGRR